MIFRHRNTRWLYLAAMMLALVAGLAFMVSGTFAAAPPTSTSTVVVIDVTPSNMNGWAFSQDPPQPAGTGSMVVGPGTPPIGPGSAQLSVPSSAERELLGTLAYNGTYLRDITALSYSNYSVGSSSQAVYINIGVDFDLTDNNTSYQGRLVYTPGGVNGAIVANTWQNWNAFTGRWFLTALPSGQCSQSNPCTIAQLITTYPNMGIMVPGPPSGAGFFGFKVGGNGSAFTGNVDNFQIATTTSNTTYNFDPDTATATPTSTDTPTPASDVYVDDSQPNCPGADGTPGNPYCTIQEGINHVAVGGTVHVAAGTYAENVVVNKSATLVGAGCGTTTVYPGFVNPDCRFGGGGSLCSGGTPGASNIILVQADNVTIHGFTLDGDNPGLTSGVVRNGADLDARNGIITNHAVGTFNNLVVYDTCIVNIYLRGVYASSGGTFNFHDNTVTNVAGEGASIAMFNFGGSGFFVHNTVSLANDAISSNHSSGTQYLNNIITTSDSGIHTDNAGDGGGTADLIANNNISNGTAGSYGAWVFVPYIAPTVRDNIITGITVGLAQFGQGAAVTPQFVGNTVNGQNVANSIGALASTDQLGFGFNDISVSFTCNMLTNNVDGYYQDQDGSHAVSAALHYNNIQGNTSFGAYNPSSTVVNATENYWGSPTGPTHPSNPGGTGDVVSDNVNFTPFLVEPASCTSGTPNPTSTPTSTFTPVDTNTPTFTPTITPTFTPGPAILTGHVTWQGRPAQPSALQALPITLTLKSGTTEANYSGTTDSSGNFTVTADLPSGSYQWRVKGPNGGPGGNTTPGWLANSGTLTLVRGTSSTQEMGLMRAGDCNNDNVVNIQDVGILRNTFNKTVGDPGYDARADFNGDNVVNISDYNLLKANFGLGGAPPITPFGGGGGKDATLPTNNK